MTEARLHVSRFEPDPARLGEFLACLWQGEVPHDLRLRSWLYLEGIPQRMLLVWEAGDDGEAWVARAFGSFGRLDTERVAQDATPGLQHALDRDLDGFAAWMRAGGLDEADIVRGLDVRRRGMRADSQEAAAAAGRAWGREASS